MKNTAPAGAGAAGPEPGSGSGAQSGVGACAQRPLRADAQRNLGSLLEAAKAVFQCEVDAAANLCTAAGDKGSAYSQRMVALLIDGLRYGASTN